MMQPEEQEPFGDPQHTCSDNTSQFYLLSSMSQNLQKSAAKTQRSSAWKTSGESRQSRRNLYTERWHIKVCLSENAPYIKVYHWLMTRQKIWTNISKIVLEDVSKYISKLENFYTSAAEERKKVFGSAISFRFMI